jgi:hypothetical protein
MSSSTTTMAATPPLVTTGREAEDPATTHPPSSVTSSLGTHIPCPVTSVLSVAFDAHDEHWLTPVPTHVRQLAWQFPWMFVTATVANRVTHDRSAIPDTELGRDGTSFSIRMAFPSEMSDSVTSSSTVAITLVAPVPDVHCAATRENSVALVTRTSESVANKYPRSAFCRDGAAMLSQPTVECRMIFSSIVCATEQPKPSSLSLIYPVEHSPRHDFGPPPNTVQCLSAQATSQ